MLGSGNVAADFFTRPHAGSLCCAGLRSGPCYVVLWVATTENSHSSFPSKASRFPWFGAIAW